MNYYAYLFHNINLVFCIIVVETMKVMLLTNEHHFHLDMKNAADVVANILLFETIVSILTAPGLGALNDILGRRNVILISYVIGSIAIFYMAFASRLYPDFVICRIIFRLFVSCGFASPITGDYIREETQGKAAGIRFIFTSIGGVLGAVYIKVMLYFSGLTTILVIVSIYIFIAGIISFTFLKGGNYH